MDGGGGGQGEWTRGGRVNGPGGAGRAVGRKASERASWDQGRLSPVKANLVGALTDLLSAPGYRRSC